MDSFNYQNYKAGRQFRFYGGHATRSPVRIPVPQSGLWYVVIDLGGYAGSFRSGVNVLPAPYKLPEIQDAPLSSVPSLVQNDPPATISEDNVREHDVFISHASEDKDEIVRPLANALVASGLDVWYDEFELKIGDSLRQKIDSGLAKSKFGIAVLSRSFFRKGWTNYELDGLVTRAVSGEQVILPIWHDITKKELIEYSPSLADKVARSTGTHTVEEIVSVIRGGDV